jgi:hypothetical protein
MTKHMDDFLNIQHEDELLDDNEETTDVVEIATHSDVIVHVDSIHDTETENIRAKALDLQEEIADIARNVEPSRSARMFEVSGQHLKIALDASNSKEKHKLEAAKLKIEAARLKIDDQTVNSLNNGMEVMADRNDLIKQLLAEDSASIVDVIVDEK